MTATTDDIGLYEDAKIYDVLHAPGTAEELDAIERLAAAHVAPRSRRAAWLEPACGTGRLVRLAAARGRDAVGFDSEPGMVADAQRRISARGLDALARIVVGDMRTFVDGGVCAPGSVGLAFNTINTFRHLMTDADAQAHLSQIDAALKPGGAYVVGLSTCAYGCEDPTEDVWTAARGALRVTQTVQYIPPTGRGGGARRERVFSHLAIETPRGAEHRDSTYALRTYSVEQWLDLIGESPLSLVGVADHEGRPAEPAMSGYRLYVLGR